MNNTLNVDLHPFAMTSLHIWFITFEHICSYVHSFCNECDIVVYVININALVDNVFTMQSFTNIKKYMLFEMFTSLISGTVYVVVCVCCFF